MKHCFESLPKERIELIRKSYQKAKHREFIASVLTEEDLKIIDDTPGMFPEDYLFWAATHKIINDKRKVGDYLDKRYSVLDKRHYAWFQCNCLEEEKHLLEESNHRNIEGAELVNDARIHNNPLLFKLFYIMKYRDKVKYEK